MTEPVPIQVVCPACGAAHAGGDCPRCGASPNEPPGSFTEQRWFVITMLLAVALFLAYPLLWSSRAFTRREKIFWTLLVLVETVLVFAAFFWVMWWCWRVIQGVRP